MTRAEKDNEKLMEENESKENEIRELQKSIVEGSGAEELLKRLQNQLKDTTESNKMLEKKCSDLESAVRREEGRMVGNDERRKQQAVDLAVAESEVERLTQDVVKKRRKFLNCNEN